MGSDVAVQEPQAAMQMMLDLERAGAIDEVSMTLPATIEELPMERWEALGRLLGSFDRRSRWYLGDWFNAGEDLYGEEAAQGTDDVHSRYDLTARVTGLEPDTLRNISSICRRVSRERRRQEVGFWTHAEVAPLEPDEQTEWLQKAIDNGWGRTALRQAIRDAKNPPADDEADDAAHDGEHLTIAERIENAARLCYHQAQRAGDGSAIVPAEPWAQLTAAIGEE